MNRLQEKRQQRFLLSLLLSLLMSVGAMAQNKLITGVVKDVAGEPVIGATVAQKGTTTGTFTDVDGGFKLNLPKGAKLLITYVGYVSQEITIGDQTTLNIVLKEDEKMLSEVVVIGYGAVKKGDATGSVTAIKPDEMNKGLQTNAQDMIAGKIAGVNVTSGGGTPGGGATLRIRGGASLNASNDPLIVIDGLAMDNEGVKGLANPLSMVNPNDIETFTVLKDASATAIYGSRASNGVIIITTKKGKAGARPRISYSGNVSVSTLGKKLEVMSGDEFRQYVTSKVSDAEAAAALGTENTDWQKQIYRTALSTDHNITVAGGFKNTPYRFSLGYTNQNGILKTSKFERYTAALNLSPTLLDKHLTLNLNAKGMYAKNRFADTGAVGAALSMDPSQSVYSNVAEFGNYFQWAVPGTDLNDSRTGLVTTNSLAMKNPLAMLEQKDERSTSKAFVGSADIDYKVHGFEDLRLHMNLGADYSTGEQTVVVSPYSGTNNYYGYNSYDTTDKYNLSLSMYAQYSKQLNDDHRFDVMGGYEWQHFHRKGNYLNYGLYPSTTLKTDASGASLAGTRYEEKSSEWATESFLVSFFGRANYSLKDRYLLTLTLRRDGTSRFAKDSRWALFPAVALGWKVNDEAFMQGLTAVNNLKLRLGYGVTGQQNITSSNYPYLPTYVASKDGAYYYFGNELQNLSRPSAYNKDLKWEETTTWNAGIDFGLWNNRLEGALDVYYRTTKDLLNEVVVSAGSNFSNKVLSNIGTMENKGVEFSLTYRPIVRKDLTWEVSANLTHNVNKITKLTSGSGEGYYVATGGITAGTGGNAQAHMVGHAASSFYLYEQVYDNAGKPIEGVFVDRNSDGVINDDDKYIYKKPAGDVQLGFSTKVLYKNWDFGLSARADLGNYVYNDVLANQANVSAGGVWSSKFLSNRLKDAVALGWTGASGYTFSDYFVQNASFLKLDNITVGYSFDKLFGKNLSGRAYVTGQNLVTITKYKGLDPEVFGGIDNNIYPRPVMGILGVSLNF